MILPASSANAPATAVDRPASKGRPWSRQLASAAMLAPILVAVYVASFWLRYDGQLGPNEIRVMTTTLVFGLAIKLAVFGWFRIYQAWDRYVTFHDLLVLAQAATISSLIMLLTDYLFLTDITTPRSIFLMDWGGTIVAVGGLRAIGRVFYEHVPWLSGAGRQTPVLIVGADDAGEALMRWIRRSPRLSYRVIGFIAEDPRSAPPWIDGVPVVGSLDETCEIAARLQAPEVLITAGELSGLQVRRLVDDAQRHQVTVRVLPSYEQLLEGSVDLRPRTVSIEDLLRRDPVELNQRDLHRWIDDRVMLVTGSAGSIGSEICRQLLQFQPRRLVVVDRSESGQFFLERELRDLNPRVDVEVCLADLNDPARMRSVFERHRPDIVFHAAAYKHVPLMERDIGEAVKNIPLATRRLADLADEYEVKSFVCISTDKAVNPTSIMGACKRVGELYVQALAAHSTCRFVTVRFGNVLDSAGSVVPIFREQIARGGPVTVTHPDITRYFMTIPEASQLVIQAGAMGRGGEIFVLDMGEPVKIVDLAADMIRLSGLRVDEDVEIKFVGLRPGEKLYEELHIDGERHLPTAHPKIMVAESHRADWRRLGTTLERLAAKTEGPHEALVDELLSLVPQYCGPWRESLPAIRRAA